MGGTKQKTILVVGDWVVDENWTVAPDRSITSTEPLGISYRSIVGRSGSVHSLSGAGRVARVLHEAREGNQEGNQVVGLGLWAKADGKYLKSLFATDASSNNNPYELSSTTQRDEPLVPETGVTLVNLADYYPEPQSGEEFCTTHGYQVFQGQPNGDLHLALRLDWERPTAPFSDAERNLAWHLDPKAVGLRDRLSEFKSSIDAIVVKCLGKGVISNALVQLLKDVFPRTPWFVSSKQGRLASWLTTLNKETLQLLFLSSSALAREAVVQWRVGNSLPSYEAVSYLSEILNEYRSHLVPNNSAIVATPSQLSLLALYANANAGKDFNKAFSICSQELEKMATRIGKASVLFGNLVADILLMQNQNFASTLHQAAERTYEWGLGEEKRLLGATATRRFDYEIKVIPWEQSTREWTESRTGLGIVKGNDGKLCFDLWRGMSAVHGYVALTNIRRNAASRLYKIVKSFVETQPLPERASSCLLMDAPGRGKSALARGLGKTLELEFRLIDLSQMSERADLLNRLDGIVTDQAEVKRRFLVFVDEIDSDDGRWYGQFLAPLESGYYVRGGNRFHIKPCFWVFAGSTGRAVATDRVTKLADLKSRLTDGEIPLSKPKMESQEEAEERLERTYIAVSILRELFPNLQYVTPGVLFAFYQIDPSVEIRRIRHLVHKVKKIEGNAILARNVSFIADDPGLGKLLPLCEAFKAKAGLIGDDVEPLVLLRDQ